MFDKSQVRLKKSTVWSIEDYIGVTVISKEQKDKKTIHVVDEPQGHPAVSETEENKQTLGVYSSKVAAWEMKTAKQHGFASYLTK